MTKDLTTLILRQNHPVIEYVLNKVSEKYELDLEEVKKLFPELKEYKKKRKRKKNVLNGYSVFLADKEIEQQIKKDNPEMPFGDISKEKGKIWKKLPENEKDVYRKKAKEENAKRAKEEEQKEEETSNQDN